MDWVLSCLGAAPFLAIPVLGVWLLVDGFRKGGMLAKGHRYDHNTSPVWFWILAGAYGSMVIGFFGLAGYVLVDYLRS
jgi:hypothetical protein